MLGPDKLDVIEQQLRVMREGYNAPFTVHDYDEFKSVLFDFYAHYQITFFNADFKRAAGNDPYWRHFAYQFVQEHLGSYRGDIRTAERNAITGREGGVIAIIDALTEGILKFHFETHVKSVFFDLLAPSDYRGLLDTPKSSLSVRLVTLGPTTRGDLAAWRTLQRDVSPMADKLEVKRDENVVDERLMDVNLVAPFVWIALHNWNAIVGALPIGLRFEVERTCETEDNCIVMPRIIWTLVRAITEVRSTRH